MDSSSDFGPVGKGFMVFHFCKILGAFGKMQKMCFQALFEVIFINHRRTKNSAGINLANRAQANKNLGVGNFSKNDVNKSKKQTLRSFGYWAHQKTANFHHKAIPSTRHSARLGVLLVKGASRCL